MDVDKLKALVDLLAETDITRLEWQNGEERIVLRRGSAATTSSMSIAGPPRSSPMAAATAPQVQEEERKLPVITSPLVGTFFRSPSPDDPPFVEVGQMVQPGQVLCIVEAMKLMNQIKSEMAGRLVEILVKNGQAVEFDQPLFRVDPAG
jgi:acetyl-CoA carboxylase biotin carboxyl carrier protein